MARIPQEKIDEIRNSVNIVDVMGQYLSLTKKGRNYVAICPFHQDTHPSLSISESKQIYMCFVCHNGGNVFKFLQEYLHISYLESVKEVALLGHVDITGYHLDAPVFRVNDKLKPYYDMHEEAFKIYSYYLQTKLGILAMDYLKGRGFDDEVIKMFGIGYAPVKSILYEAFTKLGYQPVEMENSGLVIESSRHYDRFSDRIMFPLHNSNGQVVGFSGRIYKANDEGAKYMNSPESDIFIKGDMLYNYHRALKPARDAGFVYLNEGFMDVIAMHRAGYDNVIALMGTALTNGHLQLLRRMTKKIVICLDGDNAGQNAAMKATDFLSSHGFTVRIILLPEGKDPDEIYMEDGKNALDRVLSDELTPFDFLLTYESSHLDLRNYDDRSQLFDKGIAAINLIDDDKQRDDSIRKLSSLTQFSRDLIVRRIKTKESKKREPSYSDIAYQIRETQTIVDKYLIAEKNLIFYMLNDRNTAMLYQSKAGFMYNDSYRILASYIVDYYRHHNIMEEADLIDRILNDRINDQKKNILISLLTEIASMKLPLPASSQQQAIDDYIRTISLNAVKLKKQQLLEQFKHVLDPQMQAEIVQEINNLKKEAK